MPEEHDPTAHVMDYPALDLGNKTCSKTPVSIVDLDVFVWGLDEIKDSKLPIAAVVCLPSPLSSSAQLSYRLSELTPDRLARAVQQREEHGAVCARPPRLGAGGGGGVWAGEDPRPRGHHFGKL